jgi:protein phosphatase
VLVLLVVGGLIIGRMIIRSNYYVTANAGTVLIMRGVQGSLLGYHLQEPHLLGCVSGRNDLSLISVGQSPNGCRLLRVNDLDKSGRTQVAGGMPTGSEDDAIGQIRKLVQQSLLPVCASPAPPAPPAATPAAPPAPPAATPAAPPATKGPANTSATAPGPPPPSSVAPTPGDLPGTPVWTPSASAPPPASTAPSPQPEPGTNCRAAA